MVLNWHELIIKSRVVGIPLPIKHFFCPLSHYGTDIDPKHIFCPVSNFEDDWDSLNLVAVKHSPKCSLFFITIGKAPFVLLDVLLQPVWPMCPSLPALSLFVWNVFCLFFFLSLCLFQPNAFMQCLFAEPVSFRNHLLNWIYGWRWVDTTKHWGSWAHFLNEHLFKKFTVCFFSLFFFFLVLWCVMLTLKICVFMQK